ncbi:MAG: PAS domain S-box protein [Euryarchaeota archaeon]|nr:PAS domain S-box protein [Euryarchaeota archaeon]
MIKLELKALLSISKIDLKKDLKQILNEILTIVGGAMDAHSGSIMLVNEETGELEMVATFGLPDDYIERVYSKGVPITTSPSGVVLKTGQYYLVPNIFEEPRDKPWMDLSRELGFSSQLFMPMKRSGEVIGLLNIYMANPHEFTESEIAFVTIATSQAVAVIENARLYARILNKNVELGHEITERKRAEKEIRKLRSAVEQSIDGIAVGDLELNLTYMNNAFARMHGYSPEEMIGMKVVDLHTEEQIDENERCINQIKAQGSWMGEIRRIRKDGTHFPTYMYVTLLKCDVGKPTGVLAVVRDITEHKQAEAALFKKGKELMYQITERKRAEDALKRTEEKCREIVDFLPDLISVLPILRRSELS